MIESIQKQIASIGACQEGNNELMLCKSYQDIFELYFKYIDFAFAKSFPDKEQLKKMNGYIEAGIIIDRRLVLNSPKRLAIIGKSDIELNLSKFDVCRVHAKDDTILYINASDNAYVVVDALENTQVFCRVKDQARVVVNLFIGASSAGQTKLKYINKETYDLQNR